MLKKIRIGANRKLRNTMKMILKPLKYLVKFIVLVMILTTITTYYRLTMEKPKHYTELNTWKVNEEIKSQKYILVWTEGDGVDWEFFKEKDVTFKENKCEYDNCYVTTNRKHLGRDYTKFDAVLFNSKYIINEGYRLPRRRSSGQLYIFASKDSSANYPVCDPKFDNFFNLTWTYKLDSDIPWPYFTVYDHENIAVAPRVNVKWTEVYEPALGEFQMLVAEKEHAAIWIASNCFTNSKREALYNNLSFSLKRKKFKVDSVGVCGITQCPIDLEQDCLKNMYKYFFFFAFENSLVEDYVSEKVVKAIKNYIVPVVFGDADYNRFLPPHSYINAMSLGAGETFQTMLHLMNDTKKYLDYFRWRNHYHVKENDHHVCKLCELLNTDVVKMHDDFRHWWNPKSIKAFGAKDKEVC